jgi:hypothetical protein
MTTRLSEELHREAETAKTYDVYAGSLATARRSRRRIAAAWLVVLAALAVAVPVVPAVRHDTPAGEKGAMQLPDRVGDPPFGELRTTAFPHLGAASMVYMAHTWRYGPAFDEADQFAVVGADGDGYRTQEVTYGEDRILLSPDGRTIATATVLVDLATGRSRPLPGEDGVPVAWSPDGSRMVRSGEYLTLVNLTTGVSVRLARTDEWTSAAWSPDSRQLAYTNVVGYVITDATGGIKARGPLPTSSVLAGKGAWTPDGKSIGVILKDARSWPPTWLDVDHDGQVIPGPGDLPAVPAGSGQSELLGWRPDGSAIVFVSNLDSGSAQVLALTPGAPAAQQAVAVPRDVSALDIADGAIASGLVRHAGLPFFIGPFLWAGVAGVAGVVVAVVLLQRLRRRRRPRRTPAYPWETDHGTL